MNFSDFTLIRLSADTELSHFNYLNDKISHYQINKNQETFKRKISSQLPEKKDQFLSYPAVKIGRLGVSEDFKGIGKEILKPTLHTHRP